MNVLHAFFERSPRRGAAGLWTGLAFLAIAAAGCRPAGTAREQGESPAEGGGLASLAPLDLLVVDDPALAARANREWTARAQSELRVRQASVDDVLAASQIEADAVIFPSWLLGELCERRWIAPISRKALDHPQYARGDLFELVRLRETTWGQTTYAAPFGSPTLVLYYRRDLLERVGEQPPADWAAYQRLVERLREPPEGAEGVGRPWRAAIEPLAPGWAGPMLLARAAAYARHRSQYSTLLKFSDMTPLVDGPPFVRALEELVRAVRAAGEDAVDADLGCDPRAAEREIAAGRCALAISWPTAAAAPPEDLAAEAASRVVLAELPGSLESFNYRDQKWTPRREGESGRVPLLGIAGRLGAVSASAAQPMQALEMLIWLSGKDWGARVASASPHTTLYRTSQMAAPRQWTPAWLSREAAGAYAEQTQMTLCRSECLTSLRIPGRRLYMEALDEAVRAALAGEASPAEALDRAAQSWRELTQRLGPEKQQQAYLRDLGLES